MQAYGNYQPNNGAMSQVPDDYFGGPISVPQPAYKKPMQRTMITPQVKPNVTPTPRPATSQSPIGGGSGIPTIPGAPAPNTSGLSSAGGIRTIPGVPAPQPGRGYVPPNWNTPSNNAVIPPWGRSWQQPVPTNEQLQSLWNRTQDQTVSQQERDLANQKYSALLRYSPGFQPAPIDVPYPWAASQPQPIVWSGQPGYTPMPNLQSANLPTWYPNFYAQPMQAQF